MKVAAAIAIIGLSVAALATEPAYRHGLSFIYPLSYGPQFQHFDYVNPDAPKGGSMRIAVFGSYDSFIATLDKGQPVAGISFTGYPNLLYDRLLEPALDEATSQYGRLAEGVMVADDFSWVAFKLRNGAYWHDGEPITVDDVIFTFNAIKEHGSAELKSALLNVDRVERMGPREVRYVMKSGSTREPSIALLLGRMAVLPEHYWRSRDISRTSVVPPLGSGPYRVGAHSLGRWVTFERVDDYWGRNLAVNRGRYNIDKVKFDYFRDSHVRRAAQASGVVDVALEGVAKNWATEYDKLPAIRHGWMKKELLPLTRPAGLWFSVLWNLRLPRFQDRRVREALTLLYDFRFINRALSYDFYLQGRSVFQNSPMQHRGRPGEAELELLEPYRDVLAARTFGDAYEPPASTGFGVNRSNVARALELFAEAGWEIADGKLTNVGTGQSFTIAFVVVSRGLVRTLMPYQNILRRVGIETTVTAPEVANWFYRMRTRKFDAAMRNYTPSHTPGLQLRNYFGSASADQPYGGNWGGIKDPVVDSLIDIIVAGRSKREFLAATQALDRVLLWNFYFIPRSSPPGYRLVYWDRYGRPDAKPLLRQAYLDTWWWDQQRSDRVDQGISVIDP
ncbi:MAG: extracellular solute-binding protein [Gammaproteobacteria bacterium]|nr:extracellular solute-binding protein [Gammaproteobacteria bacterium]